MLRLVYLIRRVSLTERRLANPSSREKTMIKAGRMMEKKMINLLELH